MTGMLQTAVKNKILSSLSSKDFLEIEPHFKVVDLNVYDMLVEANEPIEFAHFIESGVVSLVMSDDRSVELEIAVIGREGMSGVALLYGLNQSSHRTFVQIAGSALRIPSRVLQDAMDNSPTLQAVLLQFAHSTFTQVSRSALTYGRYKINQRLARWLLACHDRIDNDDVKITHSILSLMLGIHRPNVTAAIHELEEARAVKATRGLIRVLDRSKLEEIAGSCYGDLERRAAGLIRSSSAGIGIHNNRRQQTGRQPATL